MFWWCRGIARGPRRCKMVVITQSIQPPRALTMNLCRYQAPGFVEAVFLGFLRHRGCDSGGGALERLFPTIFINFQQSRTMLKGQGTSHNTWVYVFDMETSCVCVSYRSVGGNAI